MNRLHFLKSFLALTAGVGITKSLSAKPVEPQPVTPGKIILPPYVKEGDTIGVTCPAGAVDNKDLYALKAAADKWGLKVKCGNTIGKHWQRFAGSDDVRRKDLQDMLDDDNISAIIFGAGGYGTMRIIDDINWDKFKQKPKWLVGFSDITTIHAHVHANTGISSIHGVMSRQISSADTHMASATLSDALFGVPTHYKIGGHKFNRPGICSAPLIGGNLTILNACADTKSDIDTNGKILFIEDVSEYKYTIDRMLTSFKRRGKLEKLKGLIVGGFTATKTQDDNYYQTVDEIILDKVREYDYPICFGFPVGHQKNNYAIKLGVNYRLDVSRDSVSLIEDQINIPKIEFETPKIDIVTEK